MAKFVRSVGLALSGIGYAITTQRHMRIHCIAAIVVVATGLFLSLDVVSWSLIVLSIGLVVSAELINTAIEQAVDLASPEQHPLAKSAKDVAAGAVLAAALIAIIIGLLVLGPPLLAFIL